MEVFDRSRVLVEQPQTQPGRRVVVSGAVAPDKRAQTPADVADVGQRGPDRLRELDEERLGFVQQMLAALEHRAASLMPKGDLLGRLVGASVATSALERHWHVRIRLRLACDPHRVERVGLALPPLPRLLRGACRTHITDVVTVPDQIHRAVSTDTAGALDAPPTDRPKAQGPSLHRAMAIA